MFLHVLWVRYIHIKGVKCVVDQDSKLSMSSSNRRQLSFSLLEERVRWYMNLITPIRCSHWPLWLTPISSTSIYPLWSSSSFLPLSISSLSRISIGVLNKTDLSDLPKGFRSWQITKLFTLHRLLHSFVILSSSSPLVHTNVSGGFCQRGWWCMINSAFISSHITAAFAFHQEQSVSRRASGGEDVISGTDKIRYQHCLGL